MSTIIHTIPYQDPLRYFALFEPEPWSMLLHSGRVSKDIGRYSYIVAKPYEYIKAKDGVIETLTSTEFGCPFDTLERLYLDIPTIPIVPDLPPFQGGIVGCFSYDLVQYLEDVSLPLHDALDFPDLAVGLYDRVISFDHLAEKAWLISTGWPEKEPHKQIKQAQQRAMLWLQRIQQLPPQRPMTNNQKVKGKLQSNFSQTTYKDAVTKAIEYILSGEIFETNISQRISSKLAPSTSAYDFFQALNTEATAPFSAFINLGDHQVVSASPERFLKVEEQQVHAHPIKGTIQRGATQEEDITLAKQLLNSEKDRAENIMIVDLMRNDLSKVCDYASVNVPKLCQLETYSNVHHLVSVIEGQLRPQANLIDLLKATLPGGSITGAPKIRAMEIISELEKTRRGPFYGSVGYLSPNGDMDLNILIRTCLIHNDQLSFQIGGAITLDSNPEKEYLETLIKGSTIKKVLVGEKDYDCVD